MNQKLQKAIASIIIKAKTLNPRTVLVLSALPITGYFGWTFLSSTIKPPAEMATPDKTVQVDAILVSNPAILGGLTGSESLTEQAQKLTAGLIAYEDTLDVKLDAVGASMLTKEAKRLREAAIHELKSVDNPSPGNAMENDHYDILMSGCQIHLPPVDCVLVRFMGDGIKMMELGAIHDNAELYFKGRVRMQAAGLALFPQDPIENGGIPLQSLIDYRGAVHDLIPLLPSRRQKGYRQNATDQNMQDQEAAIAQFLNSNEMPNPVTQNILEQNPIVDASNVPAN